jgi:hypothetical protein
MSNEVEPNKDDRLAIRLTRIANSPHPVLRPLVTLAQEVGGFGPMRVTIMDPDTIEEMAKLCGVEVPELIELLRAAEAIVEHRTATDDYG